MPVKWLRRAAAALAVAALTHPLLPAAADGGDAVEPLRRVACPTAVAVSEASGYALDQLSASPSSCWYGTTNKDARRRIEFTFTRDASLVDARARVQSWASTVKLSITETPTLGPGAFAWSDGSGSNLYWELGPGAVATLSGVADPASAAAVAALFAPQLQVYTVPGEHTVGDRLWRTTCENYSTTARCRTEIWASSIQRDGDRFETVRGWQFNSLTYRWADRELWGDNPLANSGTWVDDAGRTWRTECDTATTGRGACRTYFFGQRVVAGEAGPVEQAGWVFNSQLLFS